MSSKVPHEYFKRRASDWNIIGFLNTCELESFQQIIENYLSSLESIIKTESSYKREKAQFLYDKYKEGLRPDRVLAKKWDEERAHKQVHIHEPTYFDYGFIHGSVQTISGTITGGTFATGSSESKKDQEKDEIDNFFQNPSERDIFKETDNGESEIIHRAEKHKRDEYDEIEEDESDDAEEVDENRMSKEKKEQFRKIFHEIPTEAKLVLSSKTVVEDVLFEYAKDLDYESHAHSFIICDHDDKIKKLFSKEDWKELTKKPSLPPVDYEIGKELAKYMKDDLAQLRQEVMRNFLKVNEVYDPMEHYFKEWIQITMRHLCNLYENPSAPLCRDQYEDWFTVNLFGNCFDFLMRHPKMSTDIKRTDAPSTASANRKNRAKKPKQRKLTGRKIDGIIHHPTYNMELGALEAARSFVNDGDRKLLIESFKMPKTLKDILVNMIRSKRCNNEEVYKLVAVGILHFRYNIQFVRLWLAGGSICIFSKDDIHSISDHFSKTSLLDFLKFLKAIVRSQIIIENNLKSLGFIEQKTPNEDDFKEEDLISEILGNDQDLSRPVTPPENKISIVDCFETPHKKKNKPNKKTPANKKRAK